VTRDGREACVSYWRFHRALLGRLDMPLSDVIRGECGFGSWSDHVKATMKAEPVATVGHIARFLDREPTGRELPSWDQLHQADPAFFRAGRNDTWRELMTGDDLALFDELHGETMREYGYSEEVCHAAT
jgi:hypothetical protein